MGILRAIVQPLVLPMLDIRHDLAPGGGVGAELVSYDALRRTSLLPQKPCQQSPRRLCVSADLHDFIEDVSFLVDSTPEISFLAIDSDDDLVEMPDIKVAWRLTPQATSVVGAEFDRPASDRFVGYDNAALKQHFLDQTQAQGETEIEPDGVCDDLWRKSVSLVTDRAKDHTLVNIIRTAPPS